MKRRAFAAHLALACALAAPARAEKPATPARPPNAAGSPYHLAVSGELLLGGKLADIPLTLYGVGVETGGRLHAPSGVIFTPLVAVHLLRGHTPAGLLFTSAAYGVGLDVTLERPTYAVHFLGELGNSKNTFHRATSKNEYELNQLTGQVLMGVSVRVSPWFAVRAGFGYRAIGQVGGGILVLGGTL